MIGKSSQNEKKEVIMMKYLNDVVMEEERMEEKFEIQPSLQTLMHTRGKKKWIFFKKNCIFK